MRKSMKGLLAGCVISLLPLQVQAVQDDIWSDSLGSMIEEVTEITEHTKTGTLTSTYSSLVVTWPLDEEVNYGYRILVKKGKRFVKVGTVPPEENQFLLEEIKGKPLEAGNSYTIKVVALKKKGKRKKVIWHRMIRTATMPLTPQLVSAKRKTGRKAVVSWESLENISGYELQKGTSPEGEFKTVGYLGSGKKKAVIRKLKKKKNYYIRIRAYKTVTGGRVYGEWSEPKMI